MGSEASKGKTMKAALLATGELHDAALSTMM